MAHPLQQGTKRVSVFTGSTPTDGGTQVSDSNKFPVESETVLNGHICLDNSTDQNILANDTFLGVWQDTLNYNNIIIGIKSSHNSATDGLVVQWSSDGITVHDDDVFTITASHGKVFTFTPARQYVRLFYTNGPDTTTLFNLQTIFKKGGIKSSSHRIQDNIVADDDAELVKSVLTGEDQDEVFRNIRSNEVGAMLTSDFKLEASRGNISGYEIERKFGSILSINAATPADVWSYGITPGAETYTFSADGVADIDRLSSSNSADTDLEVTIIGLDADGVEIIQTVNLNATDAQTPVAITPLWRVNRAYNANGTAFLGNIYVFVNDTTTGGVPDTVTNVRAYIPIGEGQTLQAIYTVPAGKTAYFMGLETSLTKAGGATAVGGNFKGRTRDFGKVFRTQDDFDLISSGVSNKVYNFPVPLPFNEKTDFVPTVNVTANGVGASWAFSLLIIDN